jgi:Tfp pilus assembly protein PilF
VEQANEKMLASLLERAAKEPNNIGVQLGLGRAYLLKGNLAEAKAAFRKVVERTSSFPEAYVGLARIAVQEDKPDEAIESLRAALRVNGNHVPTNLMMASLQLRRGRLDQATRHLEAALRVNPAMVAPALDLAELYIGTRRVDDALARLAAKEIAEPAARTPRYHVLVGSAHFHKKQFEPALASYRTALKLDPKLAGAHLGVGAIHEQQGEVARAADAYRKAIEAAPKDARGYNNLAWLYADRATNVDEAVNLARKAVELAPNRGEMLDTLGWAYAQKSQFHEADETLKRAIALVPNNPSVRYHFAVVQYRLGRKTEAASEIRRALQATGAFPEAAKAKELLATIGG